MEATNLNTTIRPLKEGIPFVGKIYFENIDKQELDSLIYVLTAGDDGELKSKKSGYKLGKAKPLGYGSVAIAIEKILLRNVEKKEGKISIGCVSYNAYTEPKLNGVLKSNFEYITKFDVLNGEIPSYPHVEETPEIYEWFSKNHTARRPIKNSSGYEKINMPNSRMQMAYNEYMCAMNPKLQKTKYEESLTQTLQKKQSSDYVVQGEERTFKGKVVVLATNKLVVENRSGRQFTYSIIKKQCNVEKGMIVEYTTKGKEIHIMKAWYS